MFQAILLSLRLKDREQCLCMSERQRAMSLYLLEAMLLSRSRFLLSLKTS